jgi:large subunit ribosomal protein L21e
MGCGRARGTRRNTRDLFAKGFGNKGLPNMTTYMTTYKLGDYVDIVCNGAIHKGMPYRFYHGRTGKVWNITKSAIGVQVNKQIKGRIISKRIHVRVEHVKQSRCIEEFKNRVARNEKAKSDAKRTGSESPARFRLPAYQCISAAVPGSQVTASWRRLALRRRVLARGAARVLSGEKGRSGG